MLQCAHFRAPRAELPPARAVQSNWHQQDAQAALMDWALHGRHWPHSDRSSFVISRGQRWHVQRWPQPGPESPWLLLLHGTGSSTHSWRKLAPLLAAQAGVLAVDLPGHGFSQQAPPGEAGMQGMAQGLHHLLQTLRIQPQVVVGHSAGAAIAVRLALDCPEIAQALTAIISINGALLPLHGVAGRLFSPLAKLLAAHSLVPHLFSWRAQKPHTVRRLIDATGSHIDEEGLAWYAQLVADPAHVAGALEMMARWDLQGLESDLPSLQTPLHLLAGTADKTVPASHALRIHRAVAGSSLHRLTGLGHLAQEEAPQQVLAALRPLLVPALKPCDEGVAAALG